MRIQKIIANAGIASRRKAEELIKQGKVIVNEKKASLGDKASLDDQIFVNGKEIFNVNQKKVYYLLNKPLKTITTLKDPQKRQTVMELIKVPERIFPVGRLDYYTSGALILTNDGELTHRLTHPSFEIQRVYRVRINFPLQKKELDFLNSKKVIINNRSSKQKITKVNEKSYVVTLHQGSYHHVRKLFESVEKKVINLTRIEYAGINIVNLPKGKYRKLKTKEIKWLKNLCFNKLSKSE